MEGVVNKKMHRKTQQVVKKRHPTAYTATRLLHQAEELLHVHLHPWRMHSWPDHSHGGGGLWMGAGHTPGGTKQGGPRSVLQRER